MRCLFVLICFACPRFGFVSLAQEVGVIETDRDSFTPATTTVGSNRIIFEAGYSFIDNIGAKDTHSLPEVILRYGVSDWLELRFGTNYEIGGGVGAVSGNGSAFYRRDRDELESETKMQYGLKAALTDQCGWMPESAMILQGDTPVSGKETKTTFTGTYVFGWVFDEKIVWDSAMRYGIGANEDDNYNRWLPSTVVKVEVAERCNAHLEYFGIYSQGREDAVSQSYISPGVHYLLTPNAEVGVRVGWGLGAESANFFTNIGMGLRF